MKYWAALILVWTTFGATAQTDSSKHTGFRTYEKQSYVLTMAVGFGDQFRNELRLPADFQNGQVTGFVPVEARLEYGLTKRISIAATAMYDDFYDNYAQLFFGNGETFKRFNTDNVRIYGGTAAAYYHFNPFHSKPNLDVFAGVGMALSNIRHSSAPQNDSTTATVYSHTASPYLKIGIRYYLTAYSALYADLGYEKQSLLNVGFSFRLKKRTAVPITAAPVK
jgi:hypothetical protein